MSIVKKIKSLLGKREVLSTRKEDLKKEIKELKKEKKSKKDKQDKYEIDQKIKVRENDIKKIDENLKYSMVEKKFGTDIADLIDFYETGSKRKTRKTREDTNFMAKRMEELKNKQKKSTK